MRTIGLLGGVTPARILVLGAHCDDIEIGCGATLLRWIHERSDLDICWVVFASTDARAEEARRSASAFLAGASSAKVMVHGFRDGFLPYNGADVKEAFEELKGLFAPDVVFTHYRDDRHQDHRLVSDLTWNTWRDHLILEYEVPKYDGDLGTPNMYAEVSSAFVQRKIDLLSEHFPSQAGKPWFTPDLFRSLARLRGMECAAPGGLAEAFYSRKARF